MMGLMLVENTGWFACLNEDLESYSLSGGERPDPNAWYTTQWALDYWDSRHAACEAYNAEHPPSGSPTALGSPTHYNP